MKLEKGINLFDVSADSCRSGVMIEHELLDEARNDSLVSRLASTRILDAVFFHKV